MFSTRNTDKWIKYTIWTFGFTVIIFKIAGEIMTLLLYFFITLA